MNRRVISLVLAAILVVAACSIGKRDTLVSYVDPFIGTGGHGHTFPGAQVPFGMVQASPDTRLTGWDGCSGYHHSDSVVYGFSHTHLSGTGCSDYGDILLMPTVGAARLSPGTPEDPASGYCSPFDRASESASPGYYAVRLAEGPIGVELTATKRAAMHRYRFPASDSANVIVDLAHRDEVIESYVKVSGEAEISGYRRSRAWAADQHVYFVARFSKPFAAAGIAVDDTLRPGLQEAFGRDVRCFARFATKADEAILVKVGISAVDIDGARKNLDAELPRWDFDAVRRAAEASWNGELGKIRVRGGTRDERIAFYTALYHAMLAPNLFMDVDGRYRGRDLAIHEAKDFTNYTVFSLWDTYRAEHPLFTIIEPERTVDFIKTFLVQYEQGGALPVWELAGNETMCMIGYHAVPVIVDAYAKGIRGFDEAKALEAMIHSADLDRLGLRWYRELGYIPGDREGESVSKTLEYAYDDWCIARFARSVGDTATWRRFARRAQSYRNLYDPATGFMRARVNGAFAEPFDPREVTVHYTEANAWQYTFAVQHDVPGLVDLMGGPDRFAARLDSLFAADPRTTGREQVDISGLIGQYAHGNEPSHHMAYLYSFARRPWRTQERAREIMRTLYRTGPEGLCGNEDCGQMSAWYVLSALGFYPVTPGQELYVIGSPIFREASIDVGGGKRFVVRAKRNSPRNVYIQSARLNGAPWTKTYLDHAAIAAGGEIEFVMGPRPNTAWGSSDEDAPPATYAAAAAAPVPYLASGSRVFSDSTVVRLETIVHPGAKIRYELVVSGEPPRSGYFTEPIVLRRSAALTARTETDCDTSLALHADFKKIPGGRSVKLRTAYSSQYTGGGPLGLLDEVRGLADFRAGGWQGYHGTDLDAVVDLGSVRRVRRVAAGFLRDQKSWIFLPERVEYSLSRDGVEFTTVAEWDPGAPEAAAGAAIEEYATARVGRDARYVRVFAKNVGVCPPWHEGAGEKAWLFVDEIAIE